MNAAMEDQSVFIQFLLDCQRLEKGIKMTFREYQVAVLTLMERAFPAIPARFT